MAAIAATSEIGVLHDPRLGRLREAAGKVVGSVFYATLLKTMRSSPLRGEFGHGGYGERVFEGQLDAELAERAGQASRNGLTLALIRRLSDQQLRLEPPRSASSKPPVAR